MFSGPSNLKFKKHHKVKLVYKHIESRSFLPKFGNYALQARGSGNLTARQLEAGRRVIRRSAKKKGFIKINPFPYASTTKKPTAARMGKGKGKHNLWVSPVHAGKILFEISSLKSSFRGIQPIYALSKVCKKLPFCAKAVNLVY